MGDGDQLFAAIEAVYRAGLDSTRWTDALGAIGSVTGSRAVTVDVLRLPDLSHIGFSAWNMRPSTQLEYLGLSQAESSYARHGIRHPEQRIFTDADVYIEEADIDREPLYAEFLVHHDTRYFASGVVDRGRDSLTFLTLARSPRQGLVGTSQVAMLERLLPHVRLSLEVGARMRAAAVTGKARLAALDCLQDGMAILAGDGRVLDTNAAFDALARSRDGLSVRAGRIEFAARTAQRAFMDALGRALEVGSGDGDRGAKAFLAERPSGLASLVGSIRPVFRDEANGTGEAKAVLFLRDPCAAAEASASAAADVFGLTAAEADMAAALIRGVSPVDYARDRKVSVNTAYTHLRRVKEKVGARRLTELVHRLKAALPA